MESIKVDRVHHPTSGSETLLVRGGNLVTFDPAQPLLKNCDLLVEHGRIQKMAPNIEGTFERVLDASGKWVLPGLINAHTHCYSALARGFACGQPHTFVDVLEKLWWKLDQALSLEAVRVSAELTALQAIRAGCTTLIDHHSSPNAISGSLAAMAEVFQEMGLRASLCYEVTDRNGIQGRQAGLEENRAFLASRHSDLLRGAVGLHASFTLEDESIRAAVEIAKAHNAPIHIHLAESSADGEHCQTRFGCNPVARLQALGVFEVPVLAAHGVHLSQKELEILANTRTTLIHNAQSNLNNAVGLPSLPAWFKAGLQCALGTDAMTTRMLEEARVALLAQHHLHQDPSCAFDEVLNLLTNGNPRLASRLWGYPVGQLQEGAAADLAILDYDPPTPVTEQSLGAHLIFGLSQAKVESVLCQGNLILHRGTVPGLDERGIYQKARDLAQEIQQGLA